MRVYFCISSVLIFLVAQPTLANTPPDAASVFKNGISYSSTELWGGIGVIVFTIFMAIAAIVLRTKAGFSEDGVIRLVALLLIVSGTLFLVTLGYSAEQIAPALGILGTIAGYMLGQADRNDRRKSQEEEAK